MVELRIKDVMRQKGVNTQKELADRLGVSEANLSATLRRTPSLDTLEKIADALDVEITELFAKRKQDGVGEVQLSTTDFMCPNCGQILHITKK